MVSHPEVGVLVIDLEGEHAYYEGTIEDWANLIIDEEGGVEVASWAGLR